MSKRKLIDKSKGVYLDIKSCGSSIRWAIHTERTVDRKKGKVVSDRMHSSTECSLTDCSRWITWSDYGTPSTQLKKVTRAIKTLTEYQKLLQKAVLLHLTHKPVKRKRKSAVVSSVPVEL